MKFHHLNASMLTFRARVLFGVLLFTSCSDDNADRPELINKLRAIGVEQNPVNSKPGDTVNLTFYLAGPSLQQLTSTVLTDSDMRYGVALPVLPIDAAPVEKVVGPISVYTYRATLIVPQNEVVNLAIAKQGFARIRYDVKFSAGSDSETVVGDSIIYAAGSPQLEWKAPEITITKPSATANSGIIDLDGTIGSSANETNKVGWFVSSGKVKSRRAKTTSWTDTSAGSQAVIMTARGVKSGAFSIKYQDVTIN